MASLTWPSLQTRSRPQSRQAALTHWFPFTRISPPGHNSFFFLTSSGSTLFINAFAKVLRFNRWGSNLVIKLLVEYPSSFAPSVWAALVKALGCFPMAVQARKEVKSKIDRFVLLSLFWEPVRSRIYPDHVRRGDHVSNLHHHPSSPLARHASSVMGPQNFQGGSVFKPQRFRKSQT